MVQNLAFVRQAPASRPDRHGPSWPLPSAPWFRADRLSSPMPWPGRAARCQWQTKNAKTKTACVGVGHDIEGISGLNPQPSTLDRRRQGGPGGESRGCTCCHPLQETDAAQCRQLLTSTPSEIESST
eukprot:3032608-Rhodomonas_salina.3